VVASPKKKTTTATTTTRENGQFNISGLRPGGPYTITVAAKGLQSETRHELFLELGDTPSLTFSLGSDIVQMSAFKVEGARDVSVGIAKIGTGSSVGEQEIANIATVRRDIQDIAVLDSRMFLGSLDQGGQLSAQGQNFRFNSLFVDGVRADDTFGLNSNGFSSLRSPIPMEAIERLSVELSPYDARRSGATGAFLNASIKSGTNVFRGATYYEYTDQDWRAKNPVTQRREQFRESTSGAVVGGPILANRLFFFVAYEEFRRTSAPPAPNFIPDSTQLAAVIARAKTLNYDTGNLDQPSNVSFQRTTLGKLDWNVAEGHRASFTYRRNHGQLTTFAQYSGAATTSLSNFWYDQPRKTDSYAAQLNSQWTSNLRTEATVSYSKFDGSPSNHGLPFPQVQVQGLTGRRLDTGATITNGAIFFGTESSRQLNAITTKEKQARLTAEYSVGEHTFAVGFENIATKYTNAFVQFTNGYYIFPSLTAWQAGTPVSTYQLQVPNAGFAIKDAVARWSYDAYGAFVQDTWKPSRDLTLVGSVRLDYPSIPEAPPVTTGFATAGFVRDNGKAVTRSNTTNDGNATYAPRLGFAYNIDGDRRRRLRGGLGLFQGKNPAVWLSNAYSNAGATGSINVSNPANFAFVGDPARQVAPPGVPPAPTINITDPNFKQPALWKSNLAFDQDIAGHRVSVEVYYHKVEQGLNTEFLNYAVAGTAPDGRIRYNGTIANSTAPSVTGRRRVTTGGPTGSGFGDVLYLTNTKKGESKGLTLGLSRQMRDNWTWSASWTRSHATEVSPITSSVALSNYTNRASFNPNEDVASTSNTNTKNRAVGTLTKRFTYFKSAPTTVAFIYQWRTGRPYSWVFRGDANGDGIAFNDLLYVPTGPTDPKVTWANTAERDAFFAFVDSTSLAKYKGGHPGRNSENSPSVGTVDLKITQEVRIWRNLRGEFFLSLLNVGNLLNDRWGLWTEIPFSYRRAVAAPTSYNAATNSWAYTFNSGTLDGVPTVAGDFPASRWQVQGGFRFRF
jgi:outer membrane receptor protein involved in Fe transport